MKNDKKARWLIGPVGPVQRETGAGEMRLASTPPRAPRPIVAPVDPEKDDSAEDDPEATDTSNETEALFCSRCGATVPDRSKKPGAVRCADCRGKRGKLTPEEQARRKHTPRERAEASEAIKARVAAEVAAERATFAVWLERVKQSQQIALLKAYQAVRTPEEHAAIAAQMEAQARKREELLAKREEALDAIDAAAPSGEMPTPVRPTRSRSHIDFWKPPAKKAERIAREAAAYVQSRKDARQRAKAWTTRPLASSVTDRQREALYLVEVELLSFSEGATRMGIKKRTFQELVEKARKVR